MNLDDQKLTGVGELVISDSLNAPLLELKVKRIKSICRQITIYNTNGE